jgi:hypothetical protein
MTKEELDKYKELEFAVETLVDYCNNSAFLTTTCEFYRCQAALERLYKARQEESEKDMTNVINKGGPAFPSSNEVTIGDWRSSGHSGMNLRDYFAARAMEVNLNKCECFPDEHWRMGVALDSYAMADAMLEMREMKR